MNAWDTKPEAHQEDVPTPSTDTQNVFLCRVVRAVVSTSGRRATAVVYVMMAAVERMELDVFSTATNQAVVQTPGATSTFSGRQLHLRVGGVVQRKPELGDGDRYGCLADVDLADMQ